MRHRSKNYRNKSILSKNNNLLTNRHSQSDYKEFKMKETTTLDPYMNTRKN